MAPCNCNKKKRSQASQPTGGTKASTSKSTDTSKKQSFELKLPSGKVESYSSKLRAKAEQARQGGTLRF